MEGADLNVHSTARRCSMNGKMVVLFAHWCPKCNMMMPLVDELEIYYGERLQIIRIDVEKEPEKMEEYGAELVPTFILFQDGQEVLRMAGLIGEKTVYERINAWI